MPPNDGTVTIPSTQSGGATVTPPASGATGNPPPDFRTTIPEAYRDKPYLRDAKASEDVFKMLDNAQTLIGKQGKRVPADDAPKEEWEKFHAEMGRPETPDKYEFQRAEGMEIDQETEKAVRAIFHEAGLSSKQAKLIQTKYDGLIAQAVKAQEEAHNNEFKTLSKELFGDKADDALAKSQELMAILAPEAAKKYLPGLDNQSAVLLASIMSEVQKRFVGEDLSRLKQGGGGSNVTGPTDEASIRAKGIELMKKMQEIGEFHPGYAALKQEKDALYLKLNSLTKK